MDSAHLIANMFGGSGYKEAKNIVATSAEYNQIAMRTEENEILNFIQDNEKNLDHFTLQVDLEFAEENDTFEMSEIRKALEKYTKEDDERRQLSDAELLKQIKKRLAETNQPRVKLVIYKVKLFNNSNESIGSKPFLLEEADLLFGTK